MRYLLASALALCLLPHGAPALPFDGSWREQGFLRLFSNNYIQNGGQLKVISDGTVSMLWRAVPEGSRNAAAARWSWAVEQGVAPTDLTRKGGDDRNLALYFVFTSAEGAMRVNPNRLVKLLRDPDTFGLVYVWGGAHQRGDALPSPYHPRLKTIVLRPAGTGKNTENVDLRGDFTRAFGRPPEALIGLGISADSDDTNGAIRASISGLLLD